MFVLKSTYEGALYALDEERSKYSELARSYNRLIEKINEKGGHDFLDNATIGIGFTKDEIGKLINLCHPDKHDGKKISTEMTAKLLKLRSK